jgi:LacI family transcriptional regulator
MIDSGRTRIGIVTFNSSLFNLQERKRGYVAALKENKLTAKKNWIKEVNISSKQADVNAAIDDLLSLKEPVEAILFASNTLSTLGLKYLNSLQIKVPEDLAIASFDESDASELFYAPLTHVKQPLLEMGQLATKILLESINKNNKVTQVNMEAELVIRKSTMRNGS